MALLDFGGADDGVGCVRLDGPGEITADHRSGLSWGDRFGNLRGRVDVDPPLVSKLMLTRYSRPQFSTDTHPLCSARSQRPSRVRGASSTTKGSSVGGGNLRLTVLPSCHHRIPTSLTFRRNALSCKGFSTFREPGIGNYGRDRALEPQAVVLEARRCQPWSPSTLPSHCQGDAERQVTKPLTRPICRRGFPDHATCRAVAGGVT